MSCYHPIAAFPDYSAGLSESGRYRYKLAGAYHPDFKSIDPNVIRVPCGRCLGCRLDYSRQWADRMMLELESCQGKGLFVTLTYDNDHVPFNMFPLVDDYGEVYDTQLCFTLCKKDFQNFFKSLRKHYSNRRLRFYGCGEYGGRTRRPHYHAIIFGLSLIDFTDLCKVGKNELGQYYYTSAEFCKIWKRGFICLSDVSYKTCAYVSRYCMKKAFDFYEGDGCEKEFTLMSRRPGIGRFYLDEHPDCLDTSHVFLSDSNGSVQVSIPKYFYQYLKLTDPDRYDSVMSDMKKLCTDRELFKLQSTSLSYIDMLELEENNMFNKTKILFKRRECET